MRFFSKNKRKRSPLLEAENKQLRLDVHYLVRTLMEINYQIERLNKARYNCPEYQLEAARLQELVRSSILKLPIEDLLL